MFRLHYVDTQLPNKNLGLSSYCWLIIGSLSEGVEGDAQVVQQDPGRYQWIGLRENILETMDFGYQIKQGVL